MFSKCAGESHAKFGRIMMPYDGIPTHRTAGFWEHVKKMNGEVVATCLAVGSPHPSPVGECRSLGKRLLPVSECCMTSAHMCAAT